MGVATWTWAITSLPDPSDGIAPDVPAKIVDFLDKPLAARYIRRRNNYCEAEIDVVNEDDLAIVAAAPYRRGLLGYRNGIERFHGVIVESRENVEGYTIGARDPYYTLSWRRFFQDAPVPLDEWQYTNLGDAEIAMRIIEMTNTVWPTFLVRGEINSGANRTRKFLKGDIVAEKVQYLSSLDGSFVFKIDPTPLGSTAPLSMAEFNTATVYDNQKPRAIFAYGNGTLGNVVEFERTCRPYMSRAFVAWDGGSGALEMARNDPGVQAYGLWDDQRGQVNTKDQTVARDAATHAIANSDTPRYDITINPGPDAPQLFTDFDIFDSVQVFLRRHGRQITGYKPVTRVVLSMDPDSGEELYEEIVVLDEDVADTGA